MFWVLVLYALFASVFTLAKLALQVTEPLFLIGARMTVAGLLMLGFLFLFRKEALHFQRKDVPALLLLGFFNIYLTNALEFWGLQFLTSSKTCFIYSLSPFASALLSWLVFSERMTLKKWGGLALGFLGFIPIFLIPTADESLSGTFLSFSWAELAVMGAALSSVWGWIILKGLVFDKGYSPILSNGLAMLFGGFLALIHSFFTESWEPIPVNDVPSFLMFAGALLLVSNLLGYNLYGLLLKRFSATFMSFAGFLTPLFAAFFGWLFLDETITLTFWVSATLVFVGLSLFYQEELVKKGVLSVNS